MPRNLLKSLLLPALLLFSVSCQKERNITRSFYYWKSNYKNNPAEQAMLQQLGVKKLYMKFFDVQWDVKHLKPFPSAKIQFDSAALKQLKDSNIEIIPVIFITNETISNIIPESINKLGERVYFLLAGLMDDNLLTNIKEIQIDCDWTESTKDRYFDLLRYLKMLPKLSNKTLSATIRLYQCKYLDKTGVPPVNKGMLMCYNMGNLKSQKTGNSILDPKELEKYIGSLDSYPLPLDLALPLFEWNVLFRNNEYKGLINNLPDSLLQQQSFATQKENRYVVSKDTIWNGYEFKLGDEIRKEHTNFTALLDAVKLISPMWHNPEFNFSFYHLDSTTLSKFSKNELESVYNSMRH